MRNKARVTIVLLVTILLLFSNIVFAQEEIIIGLSQRTLEHSVHQLYARIPQELAGQDGYEIFFTSADLDPAKQASDIEDMIARGANAFIIVPQNADLIVPTIAKINELGFPVVTLDCRAAGGNSITIGADSRRLGQLSSDYIFSNIDGNGKVFFIVGDPAHQFAINQTNGYRDSLANYPNIEVVAEQGAWWQVSEALKLVEDLLLVHPDVDAILCNNDLMAIGAVEALKAAGYKPGEVLVSGADGDKEVLRLIKEGWITCTVDKRADIEASTAYETVIALAKGGSVDCNYSTEGAEILTEVLLITIDNVDTRPGY